MSGMPGLLLGRRSMQLSVRVPADTLHIPYDQPKFLGKV